MPQPLPRLLPRLAFPPGGEKTPLPPPAANMRELVRILEVNYLRVQREYQQACEYPELSVIEAPMLSGEAYGIGRCLLTAGVTVDRLLELEAQV